MHKIKNKISAGFTRTPTLKLNLFGFPSSGLQNNHKSTHYAKRKLVCGFTLIELLVVISIISLLSSVIITNLATAKQNAKLAKAKVEKEEVLLALKVYASVYGGYPYKASNGSSAQYCMAPAGTPDCNLLGVTINKRITDIDTITTFENNERDSALASIIFPTFRNDTTINTDLGQIRGIIYTQCNASEVKRINSVDVCVTSAIANNNKDPFIIYPAISAGGIISLKKQIPGQVEETDYEPRGNGSGPVCGDTVCEAPENSSSCSTDCGSGSGGGQES